MSLLECPLRISFIHVIIFLLQYQYEKNIDKECEIQAMLKLQIMRSLNFDENINIDQQQQQQPMQKQKDNYLRFRNTIKGNMVSVGLNKPDIDSSDDQNTVRQRGFSSQYLNLVKKFKIKLMAPKVLDPTKKAYNFERLEGFRVKTEFSKQKDRYRIENDSKLDCIQVKPNSVSFNDSKKLQGIKHSIKTKFFTNKRSSLYGDRQSQSKYTIKSSQSKLNILLEEQRCGTFRFQCNQENLLIIENLTNHSKKIMKIKQHLKRLDINPKQTVKQIKLYVLNDQRSSVSRIDSIYTSKQQKQDIKQQICLQRLILISIVDHLSRNKINEIAQDALLCLELINGFYYNIIKTSYEQHMFQFQSLNSGFITSHLSILFQSKVQPKKDLKSLVELLKHKTNLMFRKRAHLYEKLSPIIQYSRQVTVNRAFYDILTMYAVIINEQDRDHENSFDFNLISFFSTCPSPYILKPPQKPYTLVLDLDQTILHTNTATGAYSTSYRPGHQSFLAELSQYYEIMVFTSSMESYAREATKGLQHISHFLFRQHAIRVASGFIKDLNRIGRHLQRMVIVDDIENNFKLQKENGIKISAWKGDEKDNQLEQIKKILIQIAEQKPKDIRIKLKEYTQKLKANAVKNAK